MKNYLKSSSPAVPGRGSRHAWIPRLLPRGMTIIAICMAVPLEAVEVKPVINAELLGGQNFFNGVQSSFGAVGSLVASPYTKFNDQWSLVPLYSGNYQGTQQVQDLVGGGTLFQDSQDHNVLAQRYPVVR